MKKDFTAVPYAHNTTCFNNKPLSFFSLGWYFSAEKMKRSRFLLQILHRIFILDYLKGENVFLLQNTQKTYLEECWMVNLLYGHKSNATLLLCFGNQHSSKYLLLCFATESNAALKWLEGENDCCLGVNSLNNKNHHNQARTLQKLKV